MNTPKCLNYFVYRSATKRNKWDESIKSTITKKKNNKKIKMKKSNSFSNMVNTKRLPLIIDT